jgi:hypothetical protein
MFVRLLHRQEPSVLKLALDGKVRRVRSDHGVESVIDVSEVLIDAGAECKQRTPKPALDCERVWRFRLTAIRSELASKRGSP